MKPAITEHDQRLEERVEGRRPDSPLLARAEAFVRKKVLALVLRSSKGEAGKIFAKQTVAGANFRAGSKPCKRVTGGPDPEFFHAEEHREMLQGQTIENANPPA